MVHRITSTRLPQDVPSREVVRLFLRSWSGQTCAHEEFGVDHLDEDFASMCDSFQFLTFYREGRILAAATRRLYTTLVMALVDNYSAQGQRSSRALQRYV
jgi:hypothetical protein